MPAQNMFESIRARIMGSPAFKPMEKRALFWFKTFQTDLMRWQRSLGTITFAELQREPIAKRYVSPSHIIPGHLYFFLYEPENVKTLPYYDRFPFVLVTDKRGDSFTGLNFHYLDYYWRAWLFDNLYESRRRDPDPLRVQLPFSYRILSQTTKYKQFRPCYKRYLFKQLRSPLLQVGETEWDVALWLPVELYRKAPVTDVWAESKRKF
jgi:hypothetical protein